MGVSEHVYIYNIYIYTLFRSPCLVSQEEEQAEEEQPKNLNFETPHIKTTHLEVLRPPSSHPLSSGRCFRPRPPVRFRDGPPPALWCRRDTSHLEGVEDLSLLAGFV